MATAIDDNAAYEKSDKSIWWLLNIRCTRRSPGQLQTKNLRNVFTYTMEVFVNIVIFNMKVLIDGHE